MLHYADILAALSVANIDLDDLLFEHGYVGVRIQDGAYGLRAGDAVDHCSLVWDHGFETDEQLPGICAIDARELDRLAAGRNSLPYLGRTVLVLAANRIQYGEDDAELIMEDATVLSVLSL